MVIILKRHLVAACFAAFSLAACSDPGATNTNQANEYQRQVKIYDEQARKAAELQAETERQLKLSAANQVRMEKLLRRWEKQADRYDAILDKWETHK
jgi:hypothetical protein